VTVERLHQLLTEFVINGLGDLKVVTISESGRLTDEVSKVSGANINDEPCLVIE